MDQLTSSFTQRVYVVCRVARAHYLLVVTVQFTVSKLTSVHSLAIHNNIMTRGPHSP